MAQCYRQYMKVLHEYPASIQNVVDSTQLPTCVCIMHGGAPEVFLYQWKLGKWQHITLTVLWDLKPSKSFTNYCISELNLILNSFVCWRKCQENVYKSPECNFQVIHTVCLLLQCRFSSYLHVPYCTWFDNDYYLWEIKHISCLSDLPKSYMFRMVSMKFGKQSAEHPLPETQEITQKMTKNDLSRLKNSHSSFKYVNLYVFVMNSSLVKS